MKSLVAMAGRGTRVSALGEGRPKPLIEIDHRPMVLWAADSFAGIELSLSVFVVLKDHEEEFGVTQMLRAGLPGRNVEVVLQDGSRAGQLCSVLEARELIDNDEDLIVAAADTLVEGHRFADFAGRSPECRGIISVADLPGDRWSYVRLDEHGRVAEIAEKRRVPDPAHASTGLYYFASGREFLSAADAAIRGGERVQGEYYISSVYGQYLRRGWRVETARAEAMWDMGTPEALAQLREMIQARVASL